MILQHFFDNNRNFYRKIKVFCVPLLNTDIAFPTGRINPAPTDSNVIVIMLDDPLRF